MFFDYIMFLGKKKEKEKRKKEKTFIKVFLLYTLDDNLQPSATG